MRIFHQKYFLIFLFSLLPFILAFGLYRYTRQVDDVLSVITLNTMQEIGSHDRAFIENTLERSCTSLARIGQRLRQENHPNLKELQTQLNLEHNVSAFKYLYLVDSNGKMYSGTFLIQDGTRYSFIQGILKDVPKRILRFDDYSNQIDYQEESIVYALSIPPFEIDGIRFVGLVGQTPFSDIREHMNRSSFNGQGASMVIDNHGWYVVNKSDKNGIGQHDNLLKSLEQASFSDKTTLRDLQTALKEKEDIFCTYTLEGGTYALSMTKIKGTDWYLAMSVPTTVFAEQSHHFMLLTSGSLGAAVLLCILLFFCLLHFWKTSLAAKANASARYSFLNRMSHEIRTPLNAILGLNHLMRSSLHEPQKLQDYLEKSASTSEYLLSLINDILDISKLEQASISIRQEAFSLKKMAEDLQSIMKERFAEKEIRFHTEVSLPQPFILGDEMRLKQVLLNILGNAAKFTPPKGSVRMTLSQSPVSTASSQSQIHIEIQDTGIGMSEEFQKHIFEPFSQEDKKKNQQLSEPSIRGTGLGMAISHMLICQMGGKLEVESTLGQGSLFQVSLPAEISSPPASAASVHSVSMEPAVQDTRHILIAEDNSLNAEILTEILQQAGFTVTLAVNGELAVKAFAASAPYDFDCILMDAQMPVMDGYTAARAIRKLARADAIAIRIYATTANTAPEDRIRAKEAGMNGFIAKPIDVKKLFEAIQAKKECEPS